jgi:arabinoxylan arabinofuranohydrolase
LIATLLLFGGRAHADYPIASHRFLADPASLVQGGRLYLYASNDDDNVNDNAYEMKSLVCISTSDLKNWTDHGEVLRVPRDASWAGYSWAPALAERNGRIYVYYGNNANGIGVASSTSPIGPFTDPRGSALVTASTPGASGTNSWLFDPSIFVDDDDQAYLYFGGNGDNNARVIRVNSDMVSVSGSAIALSIPYFFEASWMHKRDGVYYLSYSTNPDNGLRIDYLTSSSPTSGFTRRGTVGPQPPSNDNNNHAAIFIYNGVWYHAYHNRYVANQTSVPPGYKRNLAIERLNYAADGTLQEVVYTTDGVQQIANLNPYARVEAETMNAQSGIETEVASGGGMNLTSISDGDWVRLRSVDFGTAGARTFSARVASATGGGAIEVRLTSATGMVVGTLPVPNTGGAQVWMSATTAVTGATGVKDLYLRFTGSGFNVDSWEFAPTDTGTGGSGGAAGNGGSGGASFGGMSGMSTGGVGGTATGGAAGVGTGGQGGTTTGGNGLGGTGAGAGQSGAGGPNGGTGATSGGTASGGASTAGSAGSSDDDDDATESSGGCGCRTANGASPGALAALFGAAAAAFRRRRRTKSKRPRVSSRPFG